MTNMRSRVKGLAELAWPNTRASGVKGKGPRKAGGNEVADLKTLPMILRGSLMSRCMSGTVVRGKIVMQFRMRNFEVRNVSIHQARRRNHQRLAS